MDGNGVLVQVVGCLGVAPCGGMLLAHEGRLHEPAWFNYPYGPINKNISRSPDDSALGFRWVFYNTILLTKSNPLSINLFQYGMWGV
jgi:hypothetical protein